MESEIDHLREQLDKEREANRENRRLLAAALERIPAIEASEARESPQTGSERVVRVRVRGSRARDTEANLRGARTEAQLVAGVLWPALTVPD